jgi:ParB-like chromosome segregation protein Spo0J
MAKAKSKGKEAPIVETNNWTDATVDPRKLRPHPSQPGGRTGDGLVESVKLDGVREPLLLAADGLTILSGHRRADAAIKAGLTAVPARIATVAHGEAGELAILARSNIEREAFSAGANARLAWRMYEALEALTGKPPTAGDVARGLTVSPTAVVKESSVSTWLGIARGLPEKAREAWFDGALSQREAQEIVTAGIKAETEAKAAGADALAAEEAREEAAEEAAEEVLAGKANATAGQRAARALFSGPVIEADEWETLVKDLMDSEIVTERDYGKLEMLLYVLTGEWPNREANGDMNSIVAAAFGGDSKRNKRIRDGLGLP